ncbi:MAG TPA: hypothetical protein VM261_05205 [Kofleriaceae bacterium]|nr:hypothetical protein [Kofleriaceae bacterium]
MLFGGLLAACPRGGGGGPKPPSGIGWSLGADVLGESPVRGVALVPDGVKSVVVTSDARVRRIAESGALAWTRDVGASAGVVGIDGDVALVAVGGAGSTSVAVPSLAGALRGEPGAALVALDLGTGDVRWAVGAGSTRWAIVSAVQPSGGGDGFLVGGSFAGTLRMGALTVTAAGGGDGFVASVDRSGGVRWLRRMGGDSADAVAGVVSLGGGRFAMAGTFTGPAELGDSELVALADKTLAADVFVAVFEADGRLAWSRTFGGAREDTCAGLAALAGGAVAVAGTVRGEVDVAGRRFDARGAADGVVAVFAPDASVRSAWLVGGEDFDGITAMGTGGAAADQLVLAGWFTGSLPSGERADGIDDVFLSVGPAAGPGTIVPMPASSPASTTALTVTASGYAVALHSEKPTLHVRGF